MLRLHIEKWVASRGLGRQSVPAKAAYIVTSGELTTTRVGVGRVSGA